MLTNYGFQMTEDPESADVWLLNSCNYYLYYYIHYIIIGTVKDPSQVIIIISIAIINSK